MANKMNTSFKIMLALGLLLGGFCAVSYANDWYEGMESSSVDYHGKMESVKQEIQANDHSKGGLDQFTNDMRSELVQNQMEYNRQNPPVRPTARGSPYVPPTEPVGNGGGCPGH